MFIYKSKTALVTGASTGIGETFARTLAARGSNVILVARSEQKLQALAHELTQQYGIKAEVIALDLSRENAAAELYQAVKAHNLQVDILVNNAGFGGHGLFAEADATRQHEMVMLNITAVVDATHAFLGDMAQRGDGAIINVASTAAFQPVPYMAVYGASKAFILSFTEALWAEYRDKGVRILALCPGATETPFFEVMGSREAAVGTMSTTQAVVDAGLRALERGQSTVIEGRVNNLLAILPRFVPRQMVLGILARSLRPRNSAKGKQALPVA